MCINTNTSPDDFQDGVAPELLIVVRLLLLTPTNTQISAVLTNVDSIDAGAVASVALYEGTVPDTDILR